MQGFKLKQMHGKFSVGKLLLGFSLDMIIDYSRMSYLLGNITLVNLLMLFCSSSSVLYNL